jgi:hypothetical protein
MREASMWVGACRLEDGRVAVDVDQVTGAGEEDDGG